MARKYEVTPSKTYATEANVEKVVERAFPDSPELVYVIMNKDCLYCEDHGLCEAEISIVLTELMEEKP